jgi:hypothetical protein
LPAVIGLRRRNRFGLLFSYAISKLLNDTLLIEKITDDVGRHIRAALNYLALKYKRRTALVKGNGYRHVHASGLYS